MTGGDLHAGYDLRCQNAEDGELHVEVKGTQSDGEEVFLTPNEVRHASATSECDAEHALIVVSEITVRRDNDIKCLGGRLYAGWPWSIADDDSALTPTEYSYRVRIDLSNE